MTDVHKVTVNLNAQADDAMIDAHHLTEQSRTDVINKALVVYGEVLKMAIEGDFEVRLINLIGDGRDFVLSVRDA